ncbi:MAG: TnpV protein [Clostridiales bacterium]|nr:TnpV protein [Clostridiales bacterium]
MRITYTAVRGFLLPDIRLSEPPGDLTKPLGMYGHMQKSYLCEHKPITYSRLLLSERLYPICRETDEAATARLATIPDREIARDVILAELVYD